MMCRRHGGFYLRLLFYVVAPLGLMLLAVGWSACAVLLSRRAGARRRFTMNRVAPQIEVDAPPSTPPRSPPPASPSAIGTYYAHLPSPTASLSSSPSSRSPKLKEAWVADPELSATAANGRTSDNLPDAWESSWRLGKPTPSAGRRFGGGAAGSAREPGFVLATLLHALPTILCICFFAFPMVATIAFRSFVCLHFVEDGVAFLEEVWSSIGIQ